MKIQGSAVGRKSVLEIVGYGAWNDGTLIDNTIFEKKGMFFKGGIPVTSQTIEEGTSSPIK